MMMDKTAISVALAALALLRCSSPPAVLAFTSTHAGSGYVRRRHCRTAVSPGALAAAGGRGFLRMDVEDDGSRDAGREVRRILARGSGNRNNSVGGTAFSRDLPNLLHGAASPLVGGRKRRSSENAARLGDAEFRHGMPWTDSVVAAGEGKGMYTRPEFELSPVVYGCSEEREQGRGGGEPLGIFADDDELCDVDGASSSNLLFMPFWTWQMSYMKSELSGLRPLDTTGGGFDVGLNHSPPSTQGGAGPARVVNHAYASDEYRKIRMTYYDAGDKVQVFNSLWYPDPKYDLPVLGIDLLAFGRKKYLTVVDFQPIHGTEDEHAAPYERLLGPIREKFPSLQGSMTDRFYDSNRHFSSETLFGRFEDEGVVAEEVWPAFRRSVEAHVSLVRGTEPDDSSAAMVRTLRGQRAYDRYSAKRDPAHALFSRIFGKEWADGYVYDFLFDLSGGPEEQEEEGDDGGKSR